MEGKVFRIIHLVIKICLIRRLINDECDVKKAFVCVAESLEEPHSQQCPDGFIAYKAECYYHSKEKGDYDSAEINCALRGSRILAIKDRATYHFIQSFASSQKIGNFFLGLNFTTGDVTAPVKYSDGATFNKSLDYSFDESRDKFGTKSCAYLKKGVRYKPRDTDCREPMEQVCQWNSKNI